MYHNISLYNLFEMWTHLSTFASADTFNFRTMHGLRVSTYFMMLRHTMELVAAIRENESHVTCGPTAETELVPVSVRWAAELTDTCQLIAEAYLIELAMSTD